MSRTREPRRSRAHRGRLRRARLAWPLALALVLAAGPVVAQPAVGPLLGALGLATPSLRVPPAFAARTLEGEVVSVDELRGRVLLITFWATWCPPCRQEMPHFEHLHREFAPAGLSVLAVNAYEDVDEVTAFGRELRLSLPLLLDPGGDVLRSYVVIGLPTTVLVARDGRVVGRAVGARDWGGDKARALVRALLAEPAGTPIRR